MHRRKRAYSTHVGHIRIAGPPDRLEPDADELDYEWLLPRIDARGYAGWVGCECRDGAAFDEDVTDLAGWSHADVMLLSCHGASTGQERP